MIVRIVEIANLHIFVNNVFPSGRRSSQTPVLRTSDGRRLPGILWEGQWGEDVWHREWRVQ